LESKPYVPQEQKPCTLPLILGNQAWTY